MKAETRDQFQAGTIWAGGAYFDDDGTYSHCYLHATFPEGWETTFYLDAKRILEVEIEEPEGMDIDFDPNLTAGIDGRRLTSVTMRVDEEALWMADWLVL
ncbi:MAG: hypothetical protein O3A96_02625 [Proteobacteria bacterium]|nr:hypothetical protein [Pseudomonadota bacterium]